MRDLISILAFLAISQMSFSQNKVLIIGIDGCRADALEKAYTPNLDSLRNSGIYCPTSWQLGKTKSGPGWSSMLTGVWDSKHNVCDNKFSSHNFDNYPFLPSYLKRLDATKSSALVVGWKALFHVSKNRGWDKCIKGKNDNDCQKQITKLLKEADFDINMVHFNDVDFAGHTTGFELDNQKYINAIEEVDRKIGELLKAIKSRPNAQNENWLIISSTDHGGTGKHHSGNSIEERKIWWIASSAQLQKMEISAADPGSYFYEGMAVDSTIVNFYPSIVDVTATAIHHLFPSLDNTTFKAWGLDGKSWLNFNIEKSIDFYSENISEQTKNNCKYFNNACSIEITLKELKK
jgi:predicted AlkP superfamily pyrophosphatase or phosphodiesterase